MPGYNNGYKINGVVHDLRPPQLLDRLEREEIMERVRARQDRERREEGARAAGAYTLRQEVPETYYQEPEDPTLDQPAV